MRIVSLVPSTTETLRALGIDPVACTRFCEQPDLRHVGGTKNPDIDAIRALAPDLVVVDRQENRREDADALTSHGLRVWSSDVCTVEQAIETVDELAALIGVEAPSWPLLPTPTTPDVAVVVPIWRRPWMAIGPPTYGASLLAHVGFRVVTGAGDLHYPELDLAAVRSARPAAVLVPSEPYDFRDEHLEEFRREFSDAEVRRVDGQDLFWWGIRTTGAIERLRAQLADLVA